MSRVTLYTAGHLHTAVPHCSHSRAPIVHTAVHRENNEHGCVYLRCRAVCKLPGCVEGHPWMWVYSISASVIWETHLHSNRDIYTPRTCFLVNCCRFQIPWLEVSKMRDCFTWKFDTRLRLSGGLNAVEQHCCWDACQSSKRSNKLQSSCLRELIW